MATLVRRTWPEIRTEVITTCGGVDYTGFSDRVGQILYSAYLELALGYHHYELETTATASVATDAVAISVPTDCFILMGIHRAPTVVGNAGLGNMLDLKRASFLTARFNENAGVPTEYSRFGSSILLQRPVTAAQAGTWTIRYYKVPAPPDYAGSANPATAWLWDEPLIQWAAAKVLGRVWRPDLAAMGLQPMREWLASQVQPDLRSEVIAELPDYPTASRPTGGAQG